MIFHPCLSDLLSPALPSNSNWQIQVQKLSLQHRKLGVSEHGLAQQRQNFDCYNCGNPLKCLGGVCGSWRPPYWFVLYGPHGAGDWELWSFLGYNQRQNNQQDKSTIRSPKTKAQTAVCSVAIDDHFWFASQALRLSVPLWCS